MAGNVLVGIVMGSDSDEVEEKKQKTSRQSGIPPKAGKGGKK